MATVIALKLARPSDVDMSKMTPLPTNPTNSDLAGGLVEVHGCVEEVGARVGRVEKEVGALINRQHRMLVAFGLEDAHLGEDMTGIHARAAARGRRRRHRPLALMSQWEAAWKGLLALGSALGGIFLMVKIFVAAIPGAAAIVHATWQIILH